jgi:hypothetical protein
MITRMVVLTVRLAEEPESKAFARGEQYAIGTARKAALYVERRRQQPRLRAAEYGRG